MRVRRIAPEEGARTPFAVLAVIILLLSSFSVVFLGATTRQELTNRLLESDMLILNEVNVRLQDEIHIEIQLVGLESVHRSLEEMNSQVPIRLSVNHSLVNKTFKGLLEKYVSSKFPLEINGYHVEERGHRIDLLPSIASVTDLVPKNIPSFSTSGFYQTDNFSKIDTHRSQEFGLTNTSCMFVAVGYVNLSIQNKGSGLKQYRTAWVHTEVPVPLPFLLRKMESFQSSSLGSTSEIARLTKYILTTIAQFKALQGYGMSKASLPLELLETIRTQSGDATEVLTIKDVELAVNLALLLISSKTFRAWDSKVAESIDNHMRLPTSDPGQFSPVESMGHLLSAYSANGSIDAADLVSLYLGIGTGNGLDVNIEAILSQAMYGILDQFALKYLDYSGVMPLVDEVWKGVQVVDGVLRQAGEAIEDVWEWFTREDSDSWNQVLLNWLEANLVGEAGLENDYFLRLLVGKREGSTYGSFNGETISTYPSVDILEGPFDLRFVVLLKDEYHTWYGNGSNQTHRLRHSPDEMIVGHDYIRYAVSVSFDSEDHHLPFAEVDIGNDISASGPWLGFYEDHFAGNEVRDSTPETLRESVKEVVLEIAKDVVRRVMLSSDEERQPVSIDPSDDTPFLASLGEWTINAVSEVIDFYKSPDGMEELKDLLISFSDGEIGLLEDLKYYIWEQYDGFVDINTQLRSSVESIALDLLKNHTSIEIAEEEMIENANIPYDWSFEGNLTADLIPSEEICTVFMGGGSESRELFTDLKNSLLDDADLAFQQVKRREVDLGTGQTDKGVLIQVIDAAEEAGEGILPAILGGSLDVMDGVGLLDLVFEAVVDFIEGMTDGSEAANVQFVLPLMVDHPFEFLKGEYGTASENGNTQTLDIAVDQTQDYLPATWFNIEPTTAPPNGVLYVDFNQKGRDGGDRDYDSEDIKGKHYTDILSFSERPYETRWNISVLGSVPVSLGTKKQFFLGADGYRPVVLNRSIEVNFSTTIIIHTGWELEGVDYDLTSALLTDIIDFMNIAWDVLKAPLMETIDYLQIVADFLREAFRMLLEYGSRALTVMSDATDLVVSLLQSFLSDVLSFASTQLIEFLKEFGLEHFFIEFAGLTFEIMLTKGKESQDCQCTMWVRIEGGMFGHDLDMITYLIELDEPVETVRTYILAEGELRFGSRGLANFTLDPFMALREHFLEIHALDLDSDGDGWALDMVAPEVDIYRTSGTSLSKIIGFVPTVPIPMLGVEVGVDLGVSLKHLATHPRFPMMNLKLVLYEMLKESFLEAWEGIEMPPTLNSLGEFASSVVQGFMDRLTGRLEYGLVEALLYLDVSVSALGSGGAAGTGFRLGLVVDRRVIMETLHWFVDAVNTLMQNLLRPMDPSPFSSIPDNLAEYLGIRFEVYFGIGYPKMLRWLSVNQQKRMDATISVQPNVPALGVFAGLDWGDWKVDFGVYLDNFPLSSIGKIETMNKDSTVDMYLLKGQIHEIHSS